MGNNQSSPSNHNRLSKPKTNTNSPPALVVDSPESFRYADLSAKGRQQIKEVLLSPVEAESAAAWSNSDEDAVGELAPRGRGRPLSVISRSNSKVNSRSNSLSYFGSRHGSTARLTDFQGSRLSLVSNTQVDMEAAIRMLQEVKKNASPEDLAALHEALGSSTESPTSTTEPELNRGTSVRNSSCASLTRRRSLVQTPGLATRTSPVEGRRRTWNSWKAPHMAPEEEAKWSPVNRRTALETVEDSQDTPTARAQTPGDMDYSQLGSLKIGSLSIVNGAPPAPSPAPSSKSMLQRKSRMATADDYFTAGSDAGSSPLTKKNANRRGHVKSKSSVLPSPTLLHNNVAEVASTTDCGTSYTANQYAEDYQSELPNSPFTTAHTFGVANSLASTIFDAPTTAIETSGSSLFTATSPDPITVSTSTPEKVSHQRTAKLGQRPTPRTSDSGYSSGGSLRAGSRSRQSGRSAPAESAPLSIPDRYYASPEHVISPTSISSTASRSSGDGASSSQKRLQKRRKSQPDLPTVQSCKSATESVVPDIPSNVKANFNRRLSHQPGMDALSQTYPTKEHVTIDSTPMDYTTTNTRMSEQDCARADRQAAAIEVREVHQLTELEPDRPPTPPPHMRRRSRSLFRRKSTVDPTGANTDPTSNGIVDLGTIASSLGSSPYDAAMSRPLRQSLTSPTHPHQLGAPLPRAKSMVNMDSEVAADFARMRSKDRALNDHKEMPQQRSRSYHNLKMEAGEAKASKRRPKSFLHDAPPVPTIDSAKHGVYLQHTPSPKQKQTGNDRLSLPSAKRWLESDSKQSANTSSSTRSHAEERASPPSARPRLESVLGETENLSSSTSTHGTGPRVSKIVSQYDQQQAVNWEAHSQLWSQRRKSIGEGLRSHTGFSEASASTVNSRNMPQPRHQLVDRYSGGLQYGYEGGGSFHGSAGTRQLHSAASSKSLHWRNQYGVDLSDVPIMLQHQRA